MKIFKYHIVLNESGLKLDKQEYEILKETPKNYRVLLDMRGFTFLKAKEDINKFQMIPVNYLSKLVDVEYWTLEEDDRGVKMQIKNELDRILEQLITKQWI